MVNMSSVRFSSAEDEQLIELVSLHRALWDTSDSGWKNIVQRDQIWADIADSMNRSSSDCKGRWKSIRDHFVKQRKKEKNFTAGSVATKKRAEYWDRLRFLDSVEDERSILCDAILGCSEDSQKPMSHDADMTTTVHVDDSSQTTCQMTVERPRCEGVNSPQRPPKRISKSPQKFRRSSAKKRKHTKENTLQELIKARRDNRVRFSKYLDDANDDVDLFFKSMAATVKKFKPELVSEAKKQVFNTVMDLEDRNRRQYLMLPASNFYSTTSASSSSSENTVA